MRSFYNSHSLTKEETAALVAKHLKKNPSLEPIVLSGSKLANSWWAKAWNYNLESYADYSNRIGRGKAYVRKGSVLDLKIDKSVVCAKVLGSRVKPYDIRINIDPLKEKTKERIQNLCSHKIDSLEALIEGSFPKELEELFTDKSTNLFPTSKEIHFECSCPDWAYMCKHVASVLYGIGAKFDQDPLLFFKLRDIDFSLFIKKTLEEKTASMLKNAGKESSRSLSDEEAKRLFSL